MCDDRDDIAGYNIMASFSIFAIDVLPLNFPKDTRQDFTSYTTQVVLVYLATSEKRDYLIRTLLRPCSFEAPRIFATAMGVRLLANVCVHAWRFNQLVTTTRHERRYIIGLWYRIHPASE